MNAIEYLKLKTEICVAHVDCYKCPLVGKYTSCAGLESTHPEEAVRIVEEWSRNNGVIAGNAKQHELARRIRSMSDIEISRFLCGIVRDARNGEL